VVVPGATPILAAFKVNTIDRLLADVGRSLRMTPAAQNDPTVHATLWRALLDLARDLERLGGLDARERLGHHALWLAMNKPGGDIRRLYDALLRAGIAPHVTLTADRSGRWRCAVGARFDGAAETAARAFVALDAAEDTAAPRLH
jgi:hypothetical protein